MRGLKRNNCLTIQTMTGYKGYFIKTKARGRFVGERVGKQSTGAILASFNIPVVM